MPLRMKCTLPAISNEANNKLSRCATWWHTARFTGVMSGEVKECKESSCWGSWQPWRGLVTSSLAFSRPITPTSLTSGLYSVLHLPGLEEALVVPWCGPALYIDRFENIFNVVNLSHALFQSTKFGPDWPSHLRNHRTHTTRLITTTSKSSLCLPWIKRRDMSDYETGKFAACWHHAQFSVRPKRLTAVITQLSFFLFPVGHPMSAGCTVKMAETFSYGRK